MMDRMKLMDRQKNPFYKHSDTEFYLAERDGIIVGRIGAIVNHNHNKEHDENIGFFGFFECINDQTVADALFNAAKKFLKEHGVTAMRGPVNPSVNDEIGLLIEGFDLSPAIMMTYNPPYSVDLIEKYGFKKAKDLFASAVKSITGECNITEEELQNSYEIFLLLDPRSGQEKVFCALYITTHLLSAYHWSQETSIKDTFIRLNLLAVLDNTRAAIHNIKMKQFNS